MIWVFKSPRKLTTYLVLIAVAVVIVVKVIDDYRVFNGDSLTAVNQSPETVVTQKTKPKPIFETKKTSFTSPLDQIDKRVTKKKFAKYVTPQNSPISPEKFTGYHTGWDFEIFPGEERSDVTVVAFCDGTVIYKKYVSGYGEVLVQECRLDEQELTVLYGHLRLSSIDKVVGNKLAHGDAIGVLGTGDSIETDGERKHLHFSLHRGNTIDLRGYVKDQLLLINWIDPAKYLD